MPLTETIIHPGADPHPPDDWNTNSIALYPGTTDHHLLLPAIYHHADDSSDIGAFSNVDTVNWTRIPGGAILPAGDPNSWDAGFVTASVDLLPLPGGKVGLPWDGNRHPHQYPRNRHTWNAMKRAYAAAEGQEHRSPRRRCRPVHDAAPAGRIVASKTWATATDSRSPCASR